MNQSEIQVCEPIHQFVSFGSPFFKDCDYQLSLSFVCSVDVFIIDMRGSGLVRYLTPCEARILILAIVTMAKPGAVVKQKMWMAGTFAQKRNEHDGNRTCMDGEATPHGLKQELGADSSGAPAATRRTLTWKQPARVKNEIKAELLPRGIKHELENDEYPPLGSVPVPV